MRLGTRILVAGLAGLLLGAPLQAQSSERRAVERPTCELPAAPFQGSLSIPAPARSIERSAAGATFQINYIPKKGSLFGYKCVAFPASAKPALEYAMSIWGATLNSSVPIRVDACWSTQIGKLNPGVLAAASATSIIRDFDGAPTAGTWYPVALANALAGQDLNGATSELQIIFNGRLVGGQWYAGTDARPPAGQYDLVTVALHETGHGLGFAGSAGIAQTGTTRCPTGTPVGQGCITREGFPYAYDRLVEDGTGVSLLQNPPYASPSANLATVLTGGVVTGAPGGIFIESPASGRNKLYAPSTYQGGSTYSHFDLATYPGELMKPALPSGQAIHVPGLAGLVLGDQGWNGSGARLLADHDDHDHAVDLLDAPSAAAGRRSITAQVYPNPFNPVTTVSFSVAQTQPVEVRVYDLMGRAVANLFQGVAEADELQQLSFDGTLLATGTYFVHIVGTSDRLVQRITLLK